MKPLRAWIAVVAGLGLVAVGTSATASRPRPPRTIVLTIHHSHFSASALHAKRGETVRFVVHNTDPIDHELIVGPMPVQLRHESGRERWHPPKPGEVSIALFRTASTTYTFDEKGVVWFACHMPGHWKYGMSGRIDVS